jgi:hypothetical protein
MPVTPGIRGWPSAPLANPSGRDERSRGGSPPPTLALCWPSPAARLRDVFTQFASLGVGSGKVQR